MGIENYSTVAADNNTAAPDGWPEGMAALDVNNSARQNMADTRTQWNDAEWFEFRDGTPDGVVTFVANNQFKIVSPTSADVTGHWHVGRRVQIVNAGTFFATITATSFSVDTTTVTIDSTPLTNTTLVALSSIISALNSPIDTLSGGLLLGGVLTVENSGLTAPSSNGEGSLQSSTTSGAIITGKGSSLDILIANSAGSSVMQVSTGVTDVTFLGNITLTGSVLTWGSLVGSPEGSITAPVGSIRTRTNGGVGTTLYYKSSGTGNTGWTAVA